MVRFTGTGGLVGCSIFATTKRRDAIARVFGQNGGAYATNFDTHVQNFDTRPVTIIALV